MSRHPDGEQGVSTEVLRRITAFPQSSTYQYSLRRALMTCYDLLRRVHGVFSTLNTCDPTAISGILQRLEHAM